MAYVIFTANGSEIDRRDLTGPLTIGRAQEADVPVRDILLSRKHCRLEPSGQTWVVTDLGSKNGTYLGNRQVTRHQLKDGDELRIGRTRMTYHAGAFVPAAPGMKRREFVRPADPTEALAGTVAGFLLVEPGEVERQPGAPVPQPRPPEPTAFASEDVYSMLNEIASSSWDSIQAQASRPLVMERPLPRPSGYRTESPRRTRVAFSLQAPAGESDLSVEAKPSDADAPAPQRPAEPRKRRFWNASPRLRRQAAIGMVTAVATALFVGAWVAVVNQGPRATAAAPTPKTLPSRGGDVSMTNDLTFPPAPVPAVEAPPAAGEPVAPPAADPPAAAHAPALAPAALRCAARVAAVHVLCSP